jgi:hypothetical protein
MHGGGAECIPAFECRGLVELGLMTDWHAKSCMANPIGVVTLSEVCCDEMPFGNSNSVVTLAALML